MKELQGRTALVTGASGGIGARIAQALARAGMSVVASGRREDALASVVEGLRGLGVRAEAVVADLFSRQDVESLIDRCSSAIAAPDVLINNAGLEYAASYTRLTPDELTSMIDLNLTAPMLLTRSALPGMLERGLGHVVFVSSVAGKVGTAYQAAYSASKAGLIGLSNSLRAEYLTAPVGFSVVCPGFVAGEGMYQRMAEQGLVTNRIMRNTTVDRVAEKIVQAIREDRPEVIVSGAPLRPLLALGQLAPALIERAVPRIGLTDLFRRTASSRGLAEPQ